MAGYYRSINGRTKRSHHENGNSTSKYFSIKDGAEFHYCPPWKMESDSSVMPAFKASLGCVGGYSEDEDQSFSNDNSYLNFLITDFLPQEYSTAKKVHLDLTVGEAEAQDYTGTSLQSLHNLLAWILNNDAEYNEFANTATNGGGKFVFQKNILSKLLMIPYQRAIAYAFYATCWRGLIYLLKYDEKKEDDKQTSRRARKFEKYITSVEREKVMCNTDYRKVVSSQLGSHRLLYSAAIDCFNPDKFEPEMNDLSAALTLKCWRENATSLERYSMFSWCAGLVCVGIPEVLVGYRSPEGIVHSLELYDENTLRNAGKEFWDLNKSFAFADNLFSFVKARTESEPGAVFLFNKKNHCNHFTSSVTALGEEFLPNWFTDQLYSEK